MLSFNNTNQAARKNTKTQAKTFQTHDRVSSRGLRPSTGLVTELACRDREGPVESYERYKINTQQRNIVLLPLVVRWSKGNHQQRLGLGTRQNLLTQRSWSRE